MPSSGWQNITELIRLIVQVEPASVLDIGAGTGKYGFLCREYLDVAKGRPFKVDWKTRIDGIEIFENYITPVHRYIYDNLIIGDFAREISRLTTKYDLVLCVGVLEHFEKARGREILSEFRRVAQKAVLINVPYGRYPQEAIYGNPAEEHKASWYPGDFRRCGYLARVHRDRNINALWLTPGVHVRWSLWDRIKDELNRKHMRLTH